MSAVMWFELGQCFLVLLLVVAGDWEVFEACGAVLSLVVGCSLLVFLKDYFLRGELSEIGL